MKVSDKVSNLKPLFLELDIPILENGIVEYKISFSHYASADQPSISISGLDGEPIAISSVCAPEVTLPEGQVLLKDWRENSGIVAELVRVGLVGEAIGEVSVGYAVATVHEVQFDMIERLYEEQAEREGIVN